MCRFKTCVLSKAQWWTSAAGLFFRDVIGIAQPLPHLLQLPIDL
jgi:hypothetical protein